MERRREYLWRAGRRAILLGRRTLLMGVVNVTPDSFYDGGRFETSEQAVTHALTLVSEGADILDVGGESSRPGARPVTVAEELNRVLPVVRALRPQVEGAISVDTCKAEVAEQALQAGADIINDISSLRLDPRMASVVARSGAGLVVMHMRGEPRTMQKGPFAKDILADLKRHFEEVLGEADRCGIPRDKMVLDPGIGFGKTVDQNLQILNRLDSLKNLDLPILVGTSRKSFLGAILDRPAGERLWGTASSVTAAVLRGAHIVRVHDVKEMGMVTRVADRILLESASAE